MPRRSLLLPCLWAPLLAASLVLAGCGGSGGGGSGGMASSGKASPAVPRGMMSGAGPGGEESVQASISAPSEAVFTIYCRDFTGPNHAAVAQKAMQQVEQLCARENMGLKDFYLVRGDQRTVLYHGFYTTYDEAIDRRAAQKARRDRQQLERLVDASGSKIFPRTVFEPLERPDPAAPAEWDLRNAKGHWTLLVCTYTDPARGKQASVESVRDMRKNGIEAYYFHKDGQSHVTIGTWPADAVKRGVDLKKEIDEGRVDPMNPETIVVSMGQLDPRWRNVRDNLGRPLKLYEMKVELLHPTLREKYGSLAYAVNGDYAANDFPLLLEIPPAVNRPNPIDSEAIKPGVKVDQDPLLRRY